ncbi:MAG: ATP synthase F1 subunit epsilon [Clostridia bacterium]|nr:ATP synthase F1 subunit epsilon [Clostridia bacterium]
MKEFFVSVLAADRPFYEGPCLSVVLPTPDGEYGILANHSNAIAAVVPGTVRIRLPDESVLYAVVSQGLFKTEGNEVLVLVDSAERPEDIDVNRARHAADLAKEELLQKKSLMEYRSAQAHLARAMNRMRAGKGRGKSRS